MADASDRSSPVPRRARGFLRASGVLGGEVQSAAKRLGFAEARILTHWAEIAGPEIAAIASPVKMRRGPGGGGTLTLGVEGARAPELQMGLPVLRMRLDAAFGPGTVRRIAIVQVAQLRPVQKPRPAPPAPLSPAALDPVRPMLAGVADGELRAALQTLAENVLSRSRPT